MKILYGIQGTGNGHLTRSMEIIPKLMKKGKVDILISGTSSDLDLPFKVKYRFKGLSFVFGNNGGVDIWNTYLKMNSLRLLKEIKSLPVEKYDLVISDFEPVTSWASVLAKRPVIGLSNQVATLHPLAPKPKHSDLLGKLVLERYAPTSYNYGFHFKSLDKNIYTPVIRKKVREMEISDKGHYTVYLPSYDDDRIIKHLKRHKNTEWEVFSKHARTRYSKGNIKVFPLDTEKFLKSMVSGTGVFCNAGFGTTSEALFLKKKLLVIPMKTQYEQQCNASMLKSMGVPVIKKLKKKYANDIHDWLEDNHIVKVNYPDITEDIIDTIIENHTGENLRENFDHAVYYPFQ